MEAISMLFANPAVKILEDRLWEAATKRYLGEHPADIKDDLPTIMQKVKTAYKDTVAATVEEADQKIRAKWGQFKQVMTEDVRMAFATVLRMSDVDWYAIEVGQLPAPEVIAAPYQLLKVVTADVLFQYLRKEIDFEELCDEVLRALVAYAVDQKFYEVLEEARRHYEPFAIGGRRACFVVVEIIKGDAYFLGEEKHHSLIDMVILSSSSVSPSNGHKDNSRDAAKRWFDRDRRNRKNDRRFTADGWEIRFEELKSWTQET